MNEFPGDLLDFFFYMTNRLNLALLVVRQTMHMTNDGRVVCDGRPTLAGGPVHRASSQDVDVDVVDRLASIRSIIHDNPVAFSQARVLSTLLCNYHQVAQQLREREN